MGRGQRDAEDRVGAEPGLVGGAVELDHRAVEARLVVGVHPDDDRGDHVVDVGDGFPDALAGEAGLLAVPQLDGLVAARRGTGRNGRATRGAVLEVDVDLDGGIPARIEDLAGVNGCDGGHGTSLAAGGRAPEA